MAHYIPSKLWDNRPWWINVFFSEIVDLERHWSGTVLNERQIKLLNRLLDGFDGKLTSSKWAVIAKCSPDSALRDITQLLELGVLHKTPGGGRSTGYELADPFRGPPPGHLG